jgi:hypothetical protein
MGLSYLLKVESMADGLSHIKDATENALCNQSLSVFNVLMMIGRVSLYWILSCA